MGLRMFSWNTLRCILITHCYRQNSESKGTARVMNVHISVD